MTLGAAPRISPTTSVASQHHRVARAPRYRSHRRDAAAIPAQKVNDALSETLSTLSASRHCVLRVGSGGECRGCVVEAAEDDGSETSRWWLVNKSRPTRFVDCKPRAFALVWYVTWTASHRRWEWQGGLATSPLLTSMQHP